MTCCDAQKKQSCQSQAERRYRLPMSAADPMRTPKSAITVGGYVTDSGHPILEKVHQLKSLTAQKDHFALRRAVNFII
jgi:hypothetical protein